MRTGAVILAGGFLGAACTVTTILPYGSAPEPGTASQIVGAGGGVVTANDGTSVLIPPNALTTDVTITIAVDPSPPPLTIGTSLTAGHVFGPAGQTFALPVCVTLSYEPGLLSEEANPKNVVLYATVDDAGAYAALPTMAANPMQVTGMTSTFSEVVVGVGEVKEIDAGLDSDTCDGSDIEAGEAGM